MGRVALVYIFANLSEVLAEEDSWVPVFLYSGCCCVLFGWIMWRKFSLVQMCCWGSEECLNSFSENCGCASWLHQYSAVLSYETWSRISKLFLYCCNIRWSVLPSECRILYLECHCLEIIDALELRRSSKGWHILLDNIFKTHHNPQWKSLQVPEHLRLSVSAISFPKF